MIQTSEKSNKKCTKKKSVEHTAKSDESWSTGDESIDEFTSTEDQSSAESATTFFHGENQVQVSLPSLISLNESGASPPPSTDSATLGSLRQSPIDLSLSTPGSSSTFQNTTTETCSPTTSGKEQSADKLQLSCIEGGVGDADGEKVGTSGKWCLKYECSPSSTDIASAPPVKRARLSESSKLTSRKLFKDEVVTESEKLEGQQTHKYFIDLTQSEQDSEQSDCVPVHEPPDVVDLTCDHQSPSQLHYHTVSEVHTERDDILSTETRTNAVASTVQNLLAPPVAVELSGSQCTSTGSTVGSTGQRSASVESGADSFSSPSCLPPTPGSEKNSTSDYLGMVIVIHTVSPGRENVCSILQRPDFP